ncbi:hypothetical protein T02_977 [Trichinella nativa]|uniref:Uncharacterized protein n=1 Tax=Trichinella nativa TaxID=6335 RepID=A0A0V1L4F6_9BILA|nr:hypothetical protein T02_977 [Trichinella nativa]
MLLKLPQHPGQEFGSVRTKIGHSDCAQFIELKIGFRDEDHLTGNQGGTAKEEGTRVEMYNGRKGF